MASRWTEERVARELEAWFARRCFDAWPTYRTFVRDRHKGLHAELMRRGGPDRWADELGVPVVAHPRGRRRSDDEVRAELRALLRQHRPGRFPTQAWLREHGPAGLASAVSSSGGTQRWARELGMAPAKRVHWSDEDVERELRRLSASTRRWPTRSEFEQAELGGLLSVVYRGRGAGWWAARLGLDAGHLRRRRRGSA